MADWPAHLSFFDSWDTPLKAYIDAGDYLSLTSAFPSSVVDYDSGAVIDGGLGVYPVTRFDLSNSPVALSVGALGDPFPSWILTGNMANGWFLGDGTFDPFLTNDANGYPAAKITYIPSSNADFTGLSINGGGNLNLAAFSGDAGHPATIIHTIYGSATDDSRFTVTTKPTGSGSTVDAFTIATDHAGNQNKIGFFTQTPAAQAAYVAPGSVTAHQLGQILIDYGLMKAS